MSNVTFEGKMTRKDVVWAGATQSGDVEIVGLRYFSLELPSTFAGSAVNFEVKLDDGTYAEWYNDGALVSKTVTAGKVNQMPAELLGIADTIRIVSTDSETLTGVLRGAS